MNKALLALVFAFLAQVLFPYRDLIVHAAFAWIAYAHALLGTMDPL